VRAVVAAVDTLLAAAPEDADYRPEPIL